MESLSYSDFSQRIQQEGLVRRVPLGGTVEVTRRCPLNCVHCYNNLPPNDRGARGGELTREEHYRLIDEITAAGCLWLLYTGGEIFLRPDFLDIYTRAKRQGLLITLFTNGTLITPEMADVLAAQPPFSIEVTVYGRSREVYERVTRVPGSYNRCLKGIERLRERRLPLKLKTMALTLNRHEVREMQTWAEKDLGLEFKFDALVNSRIDGKANPLDYRLGPEEVVALDRQDPKRMKEWHTFCEVFNRPAEHDRQYSCGAGLTGFAVDPYGRLKICGLWPGEAWDLRQGSFQEGWDHFIREQRQQKATRSTRCSACTLKPLCGMCPVNGALENGDPEEPVDFLCRVGHLRAEALGLVV